MDTKTQITKEITSMVSLDMITKAKSKKMLAYLETEAGAEYIQEIDDNGYRISDCVDTIGYLV